MKIVKDRRGNENGRRSESSGGRGRWNTDMAQSNKQAPNTENDISLLCPQHNISTGPYRPILSIIHLPTQY